MAVPPARTETSPETALHYLASALAIFDPLRLRAWADLGLTTGQLRLLFLLSQQPGVTSGELATRLTVTPPTITGIIDRLVRLDLVRREEDPADRRLVRNFLSSEGENVCARLEHKAEQFMHRILAEMSGAEIGALSTGLRAFIAASERVSHREPAEQHQERQ
ncbi:MAG: MarR family transcriptional regulator [Thermoflexaceae bacterium]|nr:MarR family transcriptional regulator [Thermoflexaceae bacterium]